MSGAAAYSRVAATADGGTRFEDGEIALDAGTVSAGVPPVLRAGLPSAAGVTYMHYEAFDSTPHPAPAPQWVIMLRGTIEVTTGDGERRRFSPGDLLLVTDTEGRGHHTVTVGAGPFESLFIPIDPAWSES